MQEELNNERPELNIKLLTINKIGGWDPETSTEKIAEAGNLAMVQDSEELMIWDSWGGEWRDVAIVNRNNQLIEYYNLTLNNLGTPENFEELKQKFIAAAEEQ